MKVKKKTIAKKQTGKNSKTKKLTSKTSKKPKKQRGKTPKKTKTSKEIRDIYIERINKILDKIIKENTDKGSPENDFKVRPGYGYDKFYLTWVEGSYDMSLQSLIHYIMYEEGIYKEFLTKEQYKDVQKAIKEERLRANRESVWQLVHQCAHILGLGHKEHIMSP